MDISTLEARVALLERSLRRSRLTTVLLGLGAALVSVTAFALQSSSTLSAAQLEPRPATALQTPQEQTDDRVTTRRLVLTNELGVEMVALAAGADGSLLVLAPDGEEIMRLGGEPARRIGH